METIPPIFQQTQPSPSKNPYKILFFVALGLFLVTASLLIFVWFATFGAFTQLTSIKPEDIVEDKPVETEIISEITPTITEEVTSIPVKSTTQSDWKTYNTKINFSISVPSVYTFEDAYSQKGGVSFWSYDPSSGKYPSVGGFPVGEAKIFIYFPDQKSIDDYIKNTEAEETTKILSQKDLNILGYKAKLIKFTNDIEGASESMDYIINHDNSIFVVSILLNRNTSQSVKDKFYSDFTKIVNTIKFN